MHCPVHPNTEQFGQGGKHIISQSHIPQFGQMKRGVDAATAIRSGFAAFRGSGVTVANIAIIARITKILCELLFILKVDFFMLFLPPGLCVFRLKAVVRVLGFRSFADFGFSRGSVTLKALGTARGIFGAFASKSHSFLFCNGTFARRAEGEHGRISFEMCEALPRFRLPSANDKSTGAFSCSLPAVVLRGWASRCC
ncbi:MAG: hypothetical protein FWC70_12440 [Defluviitaleaceae bacterium]|nr:hypothetical protein [Defluviitaleaceae bacterium]